MPLLGALADSAGRSLPRERESENERKESEKKKSKRKRNVRRKLLRRDGKQ
jgi:hypothetical protein